jgi:hypothetical protein
MAGAKSPMLPQEDGYRFEFIRLFQFRMQSKESVYPRSSLRACAERPTLWDVLLWTDFRDDCEDDGVRTRFDDGRGFGGVWVRNEVEKVAVGCVTRVWREDGDRDRFAL